MRKAEIYQRGTLAGLLEELESGRWRFTYSNNYAGDPVMLTMPVSQTIHEFDRFPAAFERLLPVTWTSEMQKFHLLPSDVPAYSELPFKKSHTVSQIIQPTETTPSAVDVSWFRGATLSKIELPQQYVW